MKGRNEQITPNPSPEVRASVAGLLKETGINGACEFEALPGGANNRVFRVDAGGEAFLLKIYFRHPDDPRDRLRAEFSFSKFAWENGLRCIPRPVSSDPALNLALYEFIPGRLLESEEIDAFRVREAIDFVTELNRHVGASDAAGLPDASESCFSIEAHIECVGRRIERLHAMQPKTPVEKEAAEFIRGELLHEWKRMSQEVREHSKEYDAELSAEERRLSPSDFGYHNALLAQDGRLRFIDFEYAGWDDPAKTVCDFFCQTARPVPMAFLEMFSDAVLASLPDPVLHHRRIDALLLVYRMKWVGIILNEFRPADSARRRFAQGADDPEQRKRVQLEKARKAFAAHLRVH